MKFMMKHGERVQVIRPSDPEKALRIAEECTRDNDVERLKSLPSEVGDYTFVGWLGASADRILDDNGKAIDRLRPGDSLGRNFQKAN